MKQKGQRKMKQAEDTLEKVLQKIGPYLPKPPKAESEPRAEWKIANKGEVSPVNSIG